MNLISFPVINNVSFLNHFHKFKKFEVNDIVSRMNFMYHLRRQIYSINIEVIQHKIYRVSLQTRILSEFIISSLY